jgi:transposase-like protein
MEFFVNGTSTRRVKRAFERSAIKISGLSKSSVSRISKDLMQEYLVWANRDITKKFIYLLADAVYIANRADSPGKTGTLIIIGITEEGEKEVLHFTLGTESERNYDEVLDRLIKRGLDVRAVRRIIVDGAKGPMNSLASHFGEEKVQRCTVHKTKNILQKTPCALKGEIKAKLNRLWNQPSRIEADAFLKELLEEYGETAKAAMGCLKEDIEYLPRFYDRAPSHRKAIRSTNLIERVNREVRRRTKVMDSLPNEYSCYRIVMGVVREQNERWSKKSHWRSIK